mgnify:CR=1 FL=1
MIPFDLLLAFVLALLAWGLVCLTRAVRALGVILETQTSVLHDLTVHLDTDKG